MKPREALAWLDEHRKKHADSLLKEGEEAIAALTRALDAFDVVIAMEGEPGDGCDHDGHLWCLDDIGGGGPFSWSDFDGEKEQPALDALWCGMCGSIVYANGRMHRAAWLMEEDS